MSRYVCDSETDALLPTCTKMHIMRAYNLDTQTFQHWLEGDMGWVSVFDSAKEVVFHNAYGFDIPMLEKLFDWKPPKTLKIYDTLIWSQVLDYKRFGNDGHSLKAWGEALGYPKVEHEDWSKFTPEMDNRNKVDVELGVKVYYTLLEELKRLIAKAPQIKYYLKAEEAVTKWCTRANLHGWPFDIAAATKLQEALREQMEKAYVALNSRLGTKTVATDKAKGVVESKRPKWTKEGFYDAHTCRWFGVDKCSGFEGEERMIEGEYCRVEFVPLSLDSVADVKIFLFRNGWEPDQWNTNDAGEQTSPKITESSLEFLGGDGKLYTEFLTAKSRLSNITTWIENTDADGMLHGDCFPIGTPSMRMRHNIIVNVPAAESPWGKEMRSLFICKPGWKLIGCDSAGNQARGLAHYLGDPTFIDTLINGDIHTYNANILDGVLTGMGISWDDHLKKEGKKPEEYAKAKRAVAKRILYAFLFGASGAKLWSYIFGTANKVQGNKLKNGFTQAVPGFKALIDKLSRIYASTNKSGEGYIPSIAGNRVYVDSFHKLLVYLLQSCEKATCSAAVMLTMERLEEAGIPYIPLIMMHDEEDFMVPEEYAEKAAAIGKQAFVDGPKLFGIQIMDGDAKIGNNWYEIH